MNALSARWSINLESTLLNRAENFRLDLGEWVLISCLFVIKLVTGGCIPGFQQQIIAFTVDALEISTCSRRSKGGECSIILIFRITLTIVTMTREEQATSSGIGGSSKRDLWLLKRGDLSTNLNFDSPFMSAMGNMIF